MWCPNYPGVGKFGQGSLREIRTGVYLRILNTEGRTFIIEFFVFKSQKTIAINLFATTYTLKDTTSKRSKNCPNYPGLPYLLSFQRNQHFRFSILFRESKIEKLMSLKIRDMNFSKVFYTIKKVELDILQLVLNEYLISLRRSSHNNISVLQKKKAKLKSKCLLN